MPLFRHDPDNPSRGGGTGAQPQFHGDPAGGAVEVRQPKQRRAKKDTSPIEKLRTEEIGELPMPDETERKLTKLLVHWKDKFSALNTDLNQAVEKSRATREQVEKEMRERRKIFEAGL